MTTTTNSIGMGDDQKPSSRVLQPPGGGSSNIFGSAEESRPAQRKQPISNVFGSSSQEDHPPPQRARQQQAQSDIFGTREEQQSAPQQRQKSQGEEFPAYDVSVYAAQMTPQKRNVNRVSTYNPITGEVYPGCDDSPIENAKTGRRHVSLTSLDAVSTHNPITGEANPGFENNEISPVPHTQKGRRNIGIGLDDAAAVNPITGEIVGNASGEGDAKKAHTSSRVTNPPGGKSAGLW